MSSEALEAMRRTIWNGIGHPASYSAGAPNCPGCKAEAALVALLADVARLEQEADFHAHSYDEWRERAKAAEAALAVARKREQRLREALEAIATLRLDEGLTTEQAMTRARTQMQTFARAALVAAAAVCPACGKTEDVFCSHGWHRTAADEPGETPTRICGECDGLGLLDERDEWGFGKPCPRCGGTGEQPRGGVSPSGKERP